LSAAWSWVNPSLDEIDECLGCHRVEVESLRTGPNGVEQFVRLRGCQHEDHVFRWLLEGLEQRVSGRPRKHVGLVEDVDPPRSRSRCDGPDVHPDLANVLHLVVRCRVELDHVERCAFGDTDARRAHIARFPVARAVRTVQGLGEEARRRGLSCPPRTGEEVGVRDLVLGDLPGKGGGDMILTHDFVEALWSVLAVERLVLHRG